MENQVTLSDEQIQKIAEKAAELVRNDVYISVGKTIINRFFWFLGMVAVGVGVWMTQHGLIKIQ